MDIRAGLKSVGKLAARRAQPLTRSLEGGLRALHRRIDPLTNLSADSIEEVRSLTLDYLFRMRTQSRGGQTGYRHSTSTKRPILYATIAALLTKHLYGVRDEAVDEDLDLLTGAQGDDGLFRDPVIACEAAETEDWWGWRHLTLHALMALGLFERPAPKELGYLEQFRNPDGFRKHLDSRDWGSGAATTSNEVQNLGVMLQYARDHQSWGPAAPLMDVLHDVVDAHQDPNTGLYGDRFDTPQSLSFGVQAGYHFWLLKFYDGRPIPRAENVIDSLLATQNLLGGYGTDWHSTACEDIDSIDPLVRMSRQTDYRREDIQVSLRRALPALLQNLNSDGGWVFKRHNALQVVHPEMFSGMNESNMFYTWFRILGLAYCLIGLDEVPQAMQYDWQFGKAPGHQFLYGAY